MGSREEVPPEGFPPSSRLSLTGSRIYLRPDAYTLELASVCPLPLPFGTTPLLKHLKPGQEY